MGRLFVPRAPAIVAVRDLGTAAASVPPNIASMFFAVTVPASGGTAVGKLYASGSPTSWAIIAGNPGGNQFAINTAGLITVNTSISAGSGNAWMLVTASNAAGTSGPKPVRIQWAAATGQAPVISPNASFLNVRNVFTPAAAGTLVCRMMAGGATGAPAGALTWAITGGDPLGNFTIDQYSGQVFTAKAVSGTGTETLTITAANGSGTSSPWSLIINWQPLPARLNGYPMFPGGPVVGIPPGTQLTIVDPATINLNAGDTLQNAAVNGQVFVENNNVTLKNCSICFDGNPAIKIGNAGTGGFSGINIQNCEIWSPGMAAVVGVDSSITSTGTSGNSGTIQNCDIHDTRAVITFDFPAFAFQSNYIHDLNTADQINNHYECFQWNGGNGSGGFGSGAMTFTGNYMDNFNGQYVAINVTSNSAAANTTVTINANLLVGGGFPIAIEDKGHGFPSNVSVTNNLLGTGQNGYLNYAGGTPLASTGNIDWIDGTAHN